VNPITRISAEEALKHPWFVGNQCTTEKVIDFKAAHDALDALRQY
jgi:hypothetical protein